MKANRDRNYISYGFDWIMHEKWIEIFQNLYMNISLYILVLNVYICNFAGSSSYSYSPGRDGCTFKTSGICSSITLSDGSIRATRRQRYSLLVIQFVKLLISNTLWFLKNVFLTFLLNIDNKHYNNIYHDKRITDYVKIWNTSINWKFVRSRKIITRLLIYYESSLHLQQVAHICTCID